MSTTTPDESAPRRRRFGRKNKSGNRRVEQVWQVYQMTRKVDSSVTWQMAAVAGAVILVGVAIGFLVGHPIYAAILSVPMALLAGMWLLSRKADKAMYSQLEGQPGAAGAAISMLRRGWITEDAPVAVDPRTYDSVFRLIGRPGVVLVGDGPPHRITKMLTNEEKKHRRFISNTPIALIQVGAGEGQMPVRELTKHLTKMKPTLTKDEVTKVHARVRSMPGLQAPIPKGVDPNKARPDRKAVRGR